MVGQYSDRTGYKGLFLDVHNGVMAFKTGFWKEIRHQLITKPKLLVRQHFCRKPWREVDRVRDLDVDDRIILK
jgi:hypothetical protein